MSTILKPIACVSLLDRCREIVRRAICARLMLSDDRVGDALWPLRGDEPSVDLALV
jgi:hypothetical protein